MTSTVQLLLGRGHSARPAVRSLRSILFRSPVPARVRRPGSLDLALSLSLYPSPALALAGCSTACLHCVLASPVRSPPSIPPHTSRPARTRRARPPNRPQHEKHALPQRLDRCDRWWSNEQFRRRAPPRTGGWSIDYWPCLLSCPALPCHLLSCPAAFSKML